MNDKCLRIPNYNDAIIQSMISQEIANRLLENGNECLDAKYIDILVDCMCSYCEHIKADIKHIIFKNY